MKEKRASTNWYVAALYTLVVGLVIPFITSIVVGTFAYILLQQNFLLFWIVQSAAVILSIWLGAIYFSKYLNKSYFIRNAGKIIQLSTIYFTVFTLGSNTYDIMQIGSIGYETILSLITSLLTIIIFYWASKKYIKNNA